MCADKLEGNKFLTYHTKDIICLYCLFRWGDVLFGDIGLFIWYLTFALAFTAFAFTALAFIVWALYSWFSADFLGWWWGRGRTLNMHLFRCGNLVFFGCLRKLLRDVRRLRKSTCLAQCFWRLISNSEH